ncbi:hypothetical protein [Thermogemmatispora tikiterensis]|nr:hypothetical protein [Thermogemmatispora tikiterensis]
MSAPSPLPKPEPRAQPAHGILLASPPARQDSEPGDLATWLGLKLAQIVRMISTWQGHALACEEVQALIDQELVMIDDTLQHYSRHEELELSRREALVTIAALPTILLSWRRPEWTNEMLAEEFLPQCSASLAACWHLLKGNGLTTVQEILPRFAPTLILMARQATRYQRVAARLATQAAILQAILAMHRLDIAGRERSCLEALRCSRAAADERLECAALMYLGYTYSFCYRPRQPRKAIAVFEEALRVLGSQDSLLRSDVAMGLAEAYAQCGDERQALHYMTLAQDAFPTRPELDPSFAYAECGLNVLYQWEGKMCLELSAHFPDFGYQQRGWQAIELSLATPSISERASNESLIYQADAARLIGELDLFARYVRQGAELALTLHSQKRYNEVREVFQRAPRSWQHEPQIQRLARDFFKPLPSSG